MINSASQRWYPMVKWKVAWPKPFNNSMGVQSGVNLTSTTVSSQSHELKTSSVADHDATTNPPPMGSGSEAGAQESPSMSNVELEYDVVLLHKGKGKALPDNTAQGGSGHDPPREWERTSRLSRWNESDDRSWSHSVCPHLTTRSDDEEILDGILSGMNEVVKCSDKVMTKIIRRVEESCIEMRNSIANLHQCIKALRERHSKRGTEASHSQDSQSQTHHSRDDKPGLSLRVSYKCCKILKSTSLDCSKIRSDGLK